MDYAIENYSSPRIIRWLLRWILWRKHIKTSSELFATDISNFGNIQQRYYKIIFPIKLPFLTAFVATFLIKMPPQTEDSYGASCTSCYTTEEKKDSYSTLSNILQSKCSDELVRQVILDMMGVCADITDALRVNLVTVEGSANVFGDSQLSVDVSNEKVSSNEKTVIISISEFCHQSLYW